MLISLSFTASKTVLYEPNSTKINEPEIPGKTIAQMAIAPEKKINGKLPELVDGGKVVMKNALAVPIINRKMVKWTN